MILKLRLLFFHQIKNEFQKIRMIHCYSKSFLSVCVNGPRDQSNSVCESIKKGPGQLIKHLPPMIELMIVESK